MQSWDTANKASELSDFSVCTSWGIKGKDLYLLHVLRKRMEYPELKRAVCEQCEAFGTSVVLIEDKASGTQLIQELIDYGLHAVTRYQPQSDKIMRMHAQTAMIENGFVHLPKEAAWLPEYLHELTAFPKGKHDDQVDSTAQILDWMKRAGERPQHRCRNLPFVQSARTAGGRPADRTTRAAIGDSQAAGPLAGDPKGGKWGTEATEAVPNQLVTRPVPTELAKMARELAPRAELPRARATSPAGIAAGRYFDDTVS